VYYLLGQHIKKVIFLAGLKMQPCNLYVFAGWQWALLSWEILLYLFLGLEVSIQTP
jgi:hypothetical protein